MNKYKLLSAWMNAMRNPTIPGDGIVLYAQARMYNWHTLVYTRSSIWSTVTSSKPMTYDEVCNNCQIKLAYFGKGNYIQLIKRPTTQNLRTHFSYAENVYDRRYYEAVSDTTQPVPGLDLHQPSDIGGEVTQPTNLQSFDNEMLLLDEYPTSKLQTVENTHQEVDQCPVHGYDTSIEMSHHQKCETVQFPNSYEVCKTGLDSSLASYN